MKREFNESGTVLMKIVTLYLTIPAQMFIQSNHARTDSDNVHVIQSNTSQYGFNNFCYENNLDVFTVCGATLAPCTYSIKIMIAM